MSQPVADLGSSDLRCALAFASELAACSSQAELDGQVRLLPRLIGADTIIVGQVQRPQTGSGEPATLVAADDPPGVFDPSAREAFGRLWQQQPVVVHHFRGYSPRAVKISDFLADRQWRRSDIYNDCYARHMGLTWEIAAQIRFTPEAIACAALQRANRDFGERDRALLDLITPHLRAGFARAEAEQRGARRLALLERGLEERGEGVLLADPHGRILAAGERARAILHDWFGERQQSALLPAEVEAWRSAARGSVTPPRLDLRRPGRRLGLRLVTAEGEDVILLAERREESPSVELLARRLPISRREADVLSRLAGGRMNAGIAYDLGISPHTVGRHVERIYAKLGVHNRAEATAAALDALD